MMFEEFFKTRIIWYFILSSFVFVGLGLLTEMSMGHLQEFRSTDLAKQINFERFDDEDGPVEWATVIFAAAAGLLFAGAHYRCWRQRIFERPSHHVIMALLVLFALFVAGEEMSWGQRLFHFTTPEALRAINEQEELNIHNVKGIQLYKDGIYTIAMFLWGVVLPPAKLYFSGITRLQRRIRLPIPPLEYASVFAAAIGFRVVFKTLYGNFGQEGLEMIVALAMFLVSWRALTKPAALFE